MISKIVSGGQTGVDRAALDFALAHGIPCGGFSPKGRKAEDGIIPDRYPMEETKSSRYEERTELNILAAQGTLVIMPNKATEITNGTGLTLTLLKKKRKLFFTAFLDGDEKITRRDFQHWIMLKNIRTLNVAGPRESSFPGIYSEAYALLKKLFAELPQYR